MFEREPTQTEIQRAGWEWRNAKKRETDSSDQAYFVRNWRSLPGLRSYVEAEMRRALSTQEPPMTHTPPDGLSEADKALVERVCPPPWPAPFRAFIEIFPLALGRLLDAARAEGASNEVMAQADAQDRACTSPICHTQERCEFGCGAYPTEPTSTPD